MVPEDVPGGVEVAGEDAGEVEEAPLLHVDGGTGLDLAGCLCNQNTVFRSSDKDTWLVGPHSLGPSGNSFTEKFVKYNF